MMMQKNKFAMFSVVAVVMLSALSSQALAAPDSFFDVFLELASGSTFPSTPVKAWVQNELVAGQPLVTTAELNLSLGAATSGFGPTTLSLAEAGSGYSLVGDIKPNYIAPSSFFDVFLECYDPSHGSLSIIGTPVITPNYMAPDSFFDVFLECVGPTPGATQTFNLAYAAANGVSFSNLAIQNLDNAAGKFDLTGHLSVDSAYTAGTSAWTITVTGAVVPEPSTAVLLIMSLAAGTAGWRLRRKNKTLY